MRRLTCLLLLLAFSLFACEEATQYGPCIGANDQRSPDFYYKLSTNNVVMAIIFVETVYVPIVVVLDELYCPVARRSVPLVQHAGLKD